MRFLDFSEQGWQGDKTRLCHGVCLDAYWFVFCASGDRLIRYQTHSSLQQHIEMLFSEVALSDYTSQMLSGLVRQWLMNARVTSSSGSIVSSASSAILCTCRVCTGPAHAWKRTVGGAVHGW